MENIVIVGAGPIGLYIAIKLRQMGVENVTVIDPRADKYTYTRPGRLNPGVFSFLKYHIGTKIKESSSLHIKDVERSLFDIAIAAGVHIQRLGFIKFSANGMVVSDAKEEISLPCDFAIDASGSNRVLITEINKQTVEPYFSIQPITNVRIKNHFIAYVKMSAQDAKLISEALRSPITDHLQHTLMLEYLRTVFGWPEYSEPGFTLVELDKGKVCLYFETPPELKEDQQDNWLNALLKLVAGNDSISFEKIEPKNDRKKPRFTPFTVDPKKVLPLIFDATEATPVTVVPVGDAQIEPDYRTGEGIISGIKRANALLNAMIISDGKLFFLDTAQYETDIIEPLKKHEDVHLKLYNNIHLNIDNALTTEKIVYGHVLKSCNNPAERVIIENGLDEINCRLIMKEFHKAWTQATGI